MLKKSMSGDDIAGEVNRIVTHQFGLDPAQCRGISGDSCAANLLAIDALLKVFRKAVALPCLSHTFNNIGKQLKFDELDTFLGKLHTLLLHSAFAKALFFEMAGVRVPSTPGHRWGSRNERDLLIAMAWPGLLKFIAAYQSGDDAKSKAGRFMRDELERQDEGEQPRSVLLQLQLAVMVDVGKSVTSATIFLEGDTPLVRAVEAVCVLTRCFLCFTSGSPAYCRLGKWHLTNPTRIRPCRSRSFFQAHNTYNTVERSAASWS